MAGLVRDVLQALGMDSTLRVFEPESSTEGLARASLRVGLFFPFLVLFFSSAQRLLSGTEATRTRTLVHDITIFHHIIGDVVELTQKVYSVLMLERKDHAHSRR